MCGIAGALFTSPQAEAQLAAVVTRMRETLVHRGPDDAGTWLDAQAGIAFGFRRLSVIDLSPLGHQPMVSHSGRVVLMFNGEIFNYRELRSALAREGAIFRSESDTEVILNGVEAWGIDETVRRLVGMFSIAVWQRDTRVLTLVRDRLGVKPVYWRRSGDAFYFASELKAFRCAGERPAISLYALHQYTRYGYVPSPATIYEDMFKLPPGSILTIESGGEPEIRRYWDPERIALSARGTQAPGGVGEDEFDSLLKDAVRLRTHADVPLGAFLSGGVDSSAVVALMQAESARAVKTFSIGFEDAGFDEAPYARAIAAHLKTDHTEFRVTAADALALVPHLSSIYDEPFADSSNIPTCLLASLARKDVTVALSGDGGDELFAAYPRFAQAELAARVVSHVPLAGFIARKFGRSLRTINKDTLWPDASALPRTLQKAISLAEAERLDVIHQRLVSHWREPGSVLASSADGHDQFADIHGRLQTLDPLRRMQVTELLTSLPDDILTKVDRASMAVGLEVRVPLLDHRLVEWALTAPLPRRPKWPLRKLLDRFVPAKLVERPKMGFRVPMGEWLRGPLRSWGEDLLRMPETGSFYDKGQVLRLWQGHQSGRYDRGDALWNVLSFLSWRRRWM